MATKMRASGGGNFEKQEPVPQGNHIGILYSIVEIGTVEDEYQGEPKKAFKASLTWELPGVTGIYPNKETGQDQEMPRVISKSYTLSAHEKSSLRKMIQSWRGQNFTDEQAENFDISILLGKPCLVQVMHTTKGDNVYANIAAITGIPKGMPVPQQYNPTRYLSYDNWNWESFNALPKFLRELIEKTPEFQAIGTPATVTNSVPGKQVTHTAPKPAGSWTKPAPQPMAKPKPQPVAAEEEWPIPDNLDDDQSLPF